MAFQNRPFDQCSQYTEELGKDYRRLYTMKETGASEEQIKEQKARIKADKSRLKNTLKRLNG